MLEPWWQDPFDHWIGCGSPGRERSGSAARGRSTVASISPVSFISVRESHPSQWGHRRGESDLRRRAWRSARAAPGRHAVARQITAGGGLAGAYTMKRSPHSPHQLESNRPRLAMAPSGCQRRTRADEQSRESETDSAGPARRCGAQFSAAALEYALVGPARLR